MSDAKPEVYPPRYEQRGNWRDLICDEQEWLARPAAWGLDVLPDETRGRKQKLFQIHLYGWLAERLECETCRPFVRRAMTDDEQLSEQVLDEWRAVAHSDDGCDARSLRRHARMYHRGVVTWGEMFNHFMSELHHHRADYRAGDEKRRALALDLIGPNPFRPVSFSPAWRTDTAVSLARTMYESREFSAMPILADALQDAGCDDPAILDHCRGEGPHVRGCWVTDLVLNKS